MLPNHHITKPVFIGEIRGDGQFDVVWKTQGSGPRRCLVRLPAGLEGSGSRLGQAEVRQLQHGDQEVRRVQAHLISRVLTTTCEEGGCHRRLRFTETAGTE